MRRRIHWLLPDCESARAAMDELLRTGVDYRHMHFVGCEGANLSGLHEANLLQTSDLVRSAELGLVVGACVGGLTGALVAALYPIVGDDPQWDIALGLAIAGAIFGPWASSMIGVSAPSERLKRFAPQIEQGQVLLIVDVPVWRVEQVEGRLRALRSEGEVDGVGRDRPAFS
ncbi:hypothetical protein GCM10027034_45540 [Ramlibacter solisilvae]|uniref:Membrane protein n=1 Tax=Ramlibacter tataouinensis TaxID=94132 RepID=A0A127JSR6_9BURK|nr:hypothetical protein [Ramlibacter tataouinensis]AMO23016.1 membrane protein [Ramlibacter tataouinensis]